MKKLISWLVLLAIAVVAGVLLYPQYQEYQRRASLAPAPVPIKERIVREDRCNGVLATSVHLKVADAEVALMTVPELLRLPGHFAFDRGRDDDFALPLASLLDGYEGIRVLELVPCVGDPLRYTADELRADPLQNILLMNKRGVLKQMRKKGEMYAKMPLVKNITEIRLLP